MTCPTENEDMEILENEDVPVKEVQDPILIARNAGASLSAPAKADIARKRKLPVNKEKYKQRESKATASTTAWDRLKKFPNHHFAAIDRKLRCDACSEELSMKKSSIKKHIESRKHKNGLSDIRKNKSRNQTIVACFQRKDKRENTPGSTLPAHMRLFRFGVVESFLNGGIPLAKTDSLRPVLEKHGHRLSSTRKRKGQAPGRTQRCERGKCDFDGTARLGEALVIIIRFVQENFVPTQRLIRLEILAKALKGEELAQRLMSWLAVEYKLGPNVVIGATRECVFVNVAALRQLMFFYHNLFDVVCFSHTIDNVGNHFQFRILDLFTRYWIGMFSYSYNARPVWRERTGQSICTFGDTRW